MSEVNEQQIEVDENLDEIVFGINTKVSADELVEMINNAKNKYLKLEFTGIKVGLSRRSKEELCVVLFGSRKETQSETTSRVNEQKTKQRFLEEQELKEYLRLKRKYGPKGEE